MKRMIITGATGSIGSELVNYFYKNYELICIDIDNQKLKILKKKFQKIKIYDCNLTNQKQVNQLIKKLYLKFNNIDILINNAGSIYSQPIIKLGTKGFIPHSFLIGKR